MPLAKAGPQTTGAGTSPPSAASRTAIQSTDLLGGATVVEIQHLGQIYRLQTTRAGKLILTK
ncbi:MAG: hemin uptake protein HemP [Rhodoferax sp.]|nr:hemin uptake protein HemP [Rhodoferax sp.]